jgi:hypothetical protein
MSLVRRVRIRLQRNEDVRRRLGSEPCAKHADDGVGIAVQQNGLPRDRGVAAEVRAPQAVREHGRARPADAILVGREGPSQRRRRAEHPEVRRRHVDALDLLRQSGARQVQAGTREIVGRDRIERPRPGGRHVFRNRFGA